MKLKDATVRLSVPDGTYRSWRTLWRQRPRERVLFIGRVTGGEFVTRLNMPATLRGITAEDAMAQLEER